MKVIDKCRVCSGDLKQIIHLGDFALTGIFLDKPTGKPKKYPLTLMICKGECGLVQLKHSFDRNKLFGDHYGYRSSLNKSMVSHLNWVVKYIKGNFILKFNDTVLDIGSNDATLLKCYPSYLKKVGIEPTKKFKKYYPKDIKFINNFFKYGLIKNKAKIITSIAMFYDLEDPVSFMEQVHDTLTDDGIWISEQAYLPYMIENTAYDAICHEHQCYYRLKQMKFMADLAGFKIIDIIFNDINGGSFITVMDKKTNHAHKNIDNFIDNIIKTEEIYEKDKVYSDFKINIYKSSRALVKLLVSDELYLKTVWGYGASTKGNVLLQYCGINSILLSFILEVNEEKFGKYTPGSNIPIVSNNIKERPDYMLVLPWHFRKSIIEKEKEYLKSGGRLIFPLPKLEVVSNGT